MGESAEWHIDGKRDCSCCGIKHSSHSGCPIYYSSVIFGSIFDIDGIFQPFVDLVIDVFVKGFFEDFFHKQYRDDFNFSLDFRRIWHAIFTKCDDEPLRRRSPAI
jgi:hypothetical protein